MKYLIIGEKFTAMPMWGVITIAIGAFLLGFLIHNIITIFWFLKEIRGRK